MTDTTVPPAPPPKRDPAVGRALIDRFLRVTALQRALGHAHLTDLRTIDAEGWWADDGATSCAQWLSCRTGTPLKTCHEHLRVARKLGECRRLDEEMRIGRLGYSQLRAITRIACPENEEVLAETARYATGHQLATIVSASREQLAALRGKDLEELLRVEFRSRYDGTQEIRVRLRTEDAAIVRRALEVAERVDHGDASPTDAPTPSTAPPTAPVAEPAPAPPASADESDQACWMVDAGPSGDPLDAEGPEDPHEAPPAAAAETEETSRPRWLRPRPEALVNICARYLADAGVTDRPNPFDLMVIIDERTLEDAGRRPIGRCELLDGTPVSTAAARRLACDSSYLEVVVDENGMPIAMGRRRRSVSKALRKALILRDRTCRFPGCNRRGFVEAHHLRHWARGGETTLENLCLLCRHHHSFVHDNDLTIASQEDGSYLFVRPSGEAIPRGPTLPDVGPDPVRQVEALVAERGVRVDALTAVPKFDRDVKPDYAWCVEAVLDRTPGHRFYRPRAAPAA